MNNERNRHVSLQVPQYVDSISAVMLLNAVRRQYFLRPLLMPIIDIYHFRLCQTASYKHSSF